MKFIKNNAYIFVGALLVLSILGILINSTYVGYQQHKIKEGEPRMYGLMYVDPDGKREYLTNTNYGHTSEDITQIAELAQFETAKKQATSLLKNGWLDNVGGEIFVIEVVKIAVNPVQVTIPKKKAGYVIELQDYNGTVLETSYYKGTLKADRYRSYDFSTSTTPATRFKTEKLALEAIERFKTCIKEWEPTQIRDFERHSNGRAYHSHFATPVERNKFIMDSFKVVKFEEDN